jgi:polyisoprenoid-binding protein YceI
MWTASKLTGEHTGVVSVKAGSITETKGVLTAAEITIDMTGITCIDIESPGTNAKLVAHLKSEDFFDVEQFGTASFVSTAIEALSGVAAGKPNYRVTGDLTIKGITEPNTFDCLFWTSDGAARAAATFTFDRAQYDVKFRSSTFFPEVGDKIISDTVSLTFDIAAK